MVWIGDGHLLEALDCFCRSSCAEENRAALIPAGDVPGIEGQDLFPAAGGILE